jgi:hypothetical protein
LQSSLDRGCFKCECLLIPDSEEGLRFWRRRVGEARVNNLLAGKHRAQELIVTLEKSDMLECYGSMAEPATAATDADVVECS